MSETELTETAADVEAVVCDCGAYLRGGHHRDCMAVMDEWAWIRNRIAARIEQARAGETALRERVEAIDRAMSEQALAAWRSAEARKGLADHDALLQHADALSRWSERLREAMRGRVPALDTTGGTP